PRELEHPVADASTKEMDGDEVDGAAQAREHELRRGHRLLEQRDVDRRLSGLETELDHAPLKERRRAVAQLLPERVRDRRRLRRARLDEEASYRAARLMPLEREPVELVIERALFG